MTTTFPLLRRLSAFTTDPDGGNPAGVWIGAELPPPEEMQRIAAEVGYSETAFLAPSSGADRTVRYYSPRAEVSFCGHATIAGGVLLGELDGEGIYRLSTAVGEVPVTVRRQDDHFEASLTSVAPRQRAAGEPLVDEVLAAVRWERSSLDPEIPPALAYAGAWHLVLATESADVLAGLDYDFDRLETVMAAADLTTIQLIWREDAGVVHSRNPFPVGGIVEDPATGAAAAALGGYLRDAGLLPAPATFLIRQGEAMGRPSLLKVTVPESGGITVSGAAVPIEATPADAEDALLADADRRARRYLAGVTEQDVFPGPQALAGLERFDEPLPGHGLPAESTLQLLDEAGSPATIVSNGPRYFGFVIGATLPAAAAAERLAAAWDQCASSFVNSPVADRVERTAARWALEILDLPRRSAVAFGTSASACGLACLTAARRSLLARQGWDFDADGLAGAPPLRAIVPESVHVTILKALRVLGFGTRHLVRAAVDGHGRVDPERLPELDDRTILCLQAGEVNTGEFDLFEPLAARAKDAGAWVHVDGAFGLWARAAAGLRQLTAGVEGADSWTTDGHKWLNTPYDGAMGICRDADALAGAMNSDAVYAAASADSQKNLGIEFSRRARGIPIWAALRTLGRDGVAELVERHCRQARRLADGLRDAGFEVLNRVQLNQVLARLETDEATRAVQQAASDSGRIWFGSSVWQGRAAVRLSVSSWRTTDADVDASVELLARLKAEG
jgi:aromatic-L-amino-acid decarboxylase